MQRFACGDAEVFIKIAQWLTKRRIWDHVAGVVIVGEAGGVESDTIMRKLYFTKGAYLESGTSWRRNHSISLKYNIYQKF